MENGAVFNRNSLAEQVERVLREEIITNKLVPNQRIDVSTYAKKWSLSPTPVRDAIKALEAAGFVHISPRRGVNVAALDEAALREIYEIRIAIECTAIRRACETVPDRVALDALANYRKAGEKEGEARDAMLMDIDLVVHELALEYCGNQRLRKIMSGLNDLVRWSRLSVIRNLPKAYDTTLPEHIRICEAVSERDGERAAMEMFSHLSNSLDRICKFLGDTNKNLNRTDQTVRV